MICVYMRLHTAWFQRSEKPKKQVKQPCLLLWDNQATGGLWRSPAVAAASVESQLGTELQSQIQVWCRKSGLCPDKWRAGQLVHMGEQNNGQMTAVCVGISSVRQSQGEAPRQLLSSLLIGPWCICWMSKWHVVGGHHHCSTKCLLYRVQMR